MLNGIAPIFLFNFYKATPAIDAAINKIPIVSGLVNKFGLPPIPLYLDEKLTGIYVDAENKNIDVETDVEATKAGTDPVETQRVLNSSVTIEMLASSNSIGLTIISAMMDVILPKVTSKEYDVTYLHGAVTVFGGKINGFSINQSADTNLYRITVNLSRAVSKSVATAALSSVPAVGRVTGALPF